MNILILSCSLNPTSRSNVLARQAYENLQNMGVDVQLHDLRDYDLEFCGRPTARDVPAVGKLQAAIQNATAILMAVPVYNFYINAAAKNLIELTGRNWTNKLVGFMITAGGRASYMSVMSIANSLMLDFRCIVIPRFVYATGDAFENDRTETMTIGDEEVKERLTELTETTVKLARAFEPVLDTL